MIASPAPSEDCTAPLEPIDFSGVLAEHSPDASWEPGQVLGHRYRIGRVLEVGGMATVYEATQLDLVRRVAIKVPRNGASNSPRARRFEREARTLAALQHPHIVSVFELGRSEEGVPFMAMELVEGPALRAHMVTEGALPWRAAVSVATQLAEALQCAHASGVVHGDVSARNVLLARRGEGFESKLIDFGAARKTGDLPQPAWGTRLYVAPELLTGDAPNVLSDVYALGALLREMVGDALVASPASLQALVASMLDIDPLRRPDSAGEVASCLRGVLESESAPFSTMTALRADPADGPRRATRGLPRARQSHRRGWVAVGIAAVALSAVAALHYRVPAGPASGHVSIAAVSKPAVRVQRIAPATSEKGRFLPASLPPVPLPAPPASNIAPVAATTALLHPPTSVPAKGETAEIVARVATGAHQIDEAAESDQVVASLDQWFLARNRNGAAEYPSQTATLVGEPHVVFDPRGTSASVTFRALLMYSSGDRGTHAVVDEHVFFAKEGETWEIVDPDT